MFIGSKTNPGNIIDICSTVEGYDIFNSTVLTNLHRLESGKAKISLYNRSDLLARQVLGTPHGAGYVMIACDCVINSQSVEKSPGDLFRYYRPKSVEELLNISVKKNVLTPMNRK